MVPIGFEIRGSFKPSDKGSEAGNLNRVCGEVFTARLMIPKIMIAGFDFPLTRKVFEKLFG